MNIEQAFVTATRPDLSPTGDTLKKEPPEYGYPHTYEASFRHTLAPADLVVNLTLYPDNTYKVTASSCVPTNKFLEYTAAYARARAFVIYAELQPRV